MFLYIQLTLYVVASVRKPRMALKMTAACLAHIVRPRPVLGLVRGREGEKDRRGSDGFTAFLNAAIKGVVLCSTVPLRQSHAESKKAQPQDPLEL